jgi:flagellar motor protein MotB
MLLSENRAKAVMNQLTALHAVNPGQLVAHGVASLSPMASNSTEEGKAKNRRVEIVEQ